MSKRIEGFNCELLNQAVQDSGYRLDWIADKIGVQKRTLSAYLHGRKKPGRSTLILIAQTLEREFTDFISKKSA